MTVRKNITLTEQQERWVKAQIASGDYANESEYIRDLIRRDQRRRERVEALRSAVEEGLASGVHDGEAEEAIRGIRARLGLLPSDE